MYGVEIMTEFQLYHRIKELMSGFDKPWFIAGGWAIDLHIGQNRCISSESSACKKSP